MRDDSAEGVRSDDVQNLMQASNASLEGVSALGFNPAPLQVALPADVTQPQSSFIAPPSDVEEQWRLVKEAGGSAGAHWAYP